MENHPIPQDVTGFKFKLIGSMTVKQFLYILGFGILATVMFVLNINFFIRIPLVILFASIGAALAFIPIEGRPMDIMIANFAKTIPSENRYIFKKRGVDLSSFEVFAHPKPQAKPAAPAAVKTPAQEENNGKRALLISRLRNSSFRPDEKEVATLNSIHDLFDDNSKPAPTSGIAVDRSEPAEEKAQREERMEVLDAKIAEEVKAAEEAQKVQQTAPPPPPPPPPTPAGPEIKLAGDAAPHDVPAASVQKPMGETPNPGLSAGFPTLPDVGNVLLGIIRDPRQKSLPNILVEVLDTNGIPVRTFKTNALGQFASATQLPNGTFKIHFEDPSGQHQFSDTEVNLTGEVFQPLEIKSVDARERLRQELFGGAMAAA